MMAFLLMAGTVSAQNHYNPNAHAYDNNMPIVATVTLDGDAITTGELGAFIGGELRGSATVQASLDNTYWIQVYFDSETEFVDPQTPASNATISFKYYVDGTEPVEYDVNTTVTVNPEGVGTKGTPQVLEIVTATTQTAALAAGWNWWSTPIEITNGAAALTALENSLGTSCIRIQSRNQFIDFDEDEGEYIWDGNLRQITNEQMYKIRTSEVCSTSLTGVIANPANHPITINEGWNWIGFPCGQSVNIDDAFSGFSPEDGDVIKGRTTFSTYVIDDGEEFWEGRLSVLTPNQGYMYRSYAQGTKSLTFSNTNSRGEMPPFIANETSFEAQDASYASNMTIIAVVELNGRELRGEDYEIAIFAGNECRGTVKLKYVKPMDRYMAFLVVFGDDEENLRYLLTDGENMSWSTSCQRFVKDGMVGSVKDPVVLRFDGWGLDEENQVFVNVFPNPSAGLFNIEGTNIRKIEVVNVYGQIVISEEVCDDNVQLNLNDKASGAYLLRVTTNNGIKTQQIIKM